MDKQLADLTVKAHLSHISRFLGKVSGDPRVLSREDVRTHLRWLKDTKPGVYKNRLSALKVFYRDFLGRPEVVESFRFPAKAQTIIKVPATEDLRAFYGDLEELLARAMFLLYATSGLRRNELFRLKRKNIDLQNRMIIPEDNGSRTKRTYVTFYNEEAAKLLEQIFPEDPEARIFKVKEGYFRNRTKKFREKTGINITPQLLREWFCSEMGRLGVPDRYVDAFCGRVPASVLAKHYTDYSPEKLQEIYGKADLTVFA
ncbi:MAG: hypothetical protein AYK18_09855 [Theionarchaea archaeon DG-70]|nr:MAG: hypothetical protein AYK18_09855 [Theionarchaea archaeon DG-70]